MNLKYEHAYLPGVELEVKIKVVLGRIYLISGQLTISFDLTDFVKGFNEQKCNHQQLLES